MPPGEGRCTRCGDCCDPIHTSWRVSDLADDDQNAVVKHLWVEISEEEAEVHRSQRIGRAPEPWAPATGHYYVCSAFDPLKRLCTIQGEKPPVCSEYPYYGGERYPMCNVPSAELFGDNMRACGYWLDVPYEQVPAYVPLDEIRLAVRSLM